MERGPRDPNKKMLNAQVLAKSLLQGLAVFAASFGAYFYMISQNPDNAAAARAMGIGIIMIANLFLVQVNSSDIGSIFTTIKRLSHDKVMWTVNILVIAALLVFLYTPLNGFLKLAPLTAGQLFTVVGLAAASVLWYEIVKLVKRLRLAQYRS
jgi:Ca2+-transporting ATPase